MSIVVDLGVLDSQGFIAVGDDAFDHAGWSVSDAGDVNGDGFDDIIIGAPLNDDGADNAGKAYVIFGGPNGFDNIDLGNLQPGDGFIIQGDNHADLAGFSVSGAGDVNGDGFDDVVVGATRYGFYGAIATAYVIFGKASPSATIDLSNLALSDGFMMEGEYAYYSYGAVSVGAAGDVNGDGFDDVIIGSPYANYSAGPFFGQWAGAAYVVFGKASGFGTVDLTNLSPGAGFEMTGEPGSSDFAGLCVSGAGDINGDGFDDVIIGVRYGDNGGAYAGEAYVVFGKATGFGTVDLSNLAPGAGFIIQGDEAGDYAGWSVSAAGDVNGDGFDDVIVGAAYGDDGGTHAGEAYVIFGKASGFATIDLTNLAPGAGFVIQGDDTGDHAGWSVSAAGDVNGDGFDDVIVGAPGNDTTRGGAPRVIDAGEAYVIFGKASGFGTVDLTNLAPSDGFIIQGEASDDQAGWSVSAAGDVDGDGFDDLVVGAPFSDQGSPEAGAAYIISGGLHFTTDARNDFNGDGRSDVLWRHDDGRITDWLGTASGGFTPNSGNFVAGVAAEWNIVGTGDFNGDGRDDILWRSDSGLITDWLGAANGGFTPNSSNFVVGVGAEWNIAATGDFNGDGRDDILWRSDSGLITDWLGAANGGFASNSGNFVAGVGAEWNIVGTGDFNGDGRDDILWRNDSGAITDWLGSANGGFTPNSGNFVAGVGTEWDVAAIGDYNGDGRDDILWRNDNGTLSDWLGTANGGFATNDANALAGVPTEWHVQSPDIFWV